MIKELLSHYLSQMQTDERTEQLLRMSQDKNSD